MPFLLKSRMSFPSMQTRCWLLNGIAGLGSGAEVPYIARYLYPMDPEARTATPIEECAARALDTVTRTRIAAAPEDLRSIQCRNKSAEVVGRNRQESLSGESLNATSFADASESVSGWARHYRLKFSLLECSVVAKWKLAVRG
jgi:hypothetical protein